MKRLLFGGLNPSKFRERRGTNAERLLARDAERAAKLVREAVEGGFASLEDFT